MFTIIHPDYTTILKWLKAIQLPISIFSIKIPLHVRTGESSWTIFAYQLTMFLYLSPFKETWIISVLKYINKMHSLSWDSDRKVSQWKDKNLYAGNRFSDFMALYILYHIGKKELITVVVNNNIRKVCCIVPITW